jgi:uncharacterized metal-binding protein
MDGSPIEPAIIQISHCLLSIFLISELHVNISHKMISKVIANIHFFYFAILVSQFCVDLLEEIVIMLLYFHLRHHDVRSICCLSCILGINVQVLE